MKVDLIKHLLRAMEQTELISPMMSVENEDEDSGEYGEEGGMAKSDLKTLIRNAQELHDMLSDDQDLPEHVQSKIVLASDYIVDAANYMKSEAQNGGSEQMEPPMEEMEMEDESEDD